MAKQSGRRPATEAEKKRRARKAREKRAADKAVKARIPRDPEPVAEENLDQVMADVVNTTPPELVEESLMTQDEVYAELEAKQEMERAAAGDDAHEVMRARPDGAPSNADVLARLAELEDERTQAEPSMAPRPLDLSTASIEELVRALQERGVTVKGGGGVDADGFPDLPPIEARPTVKQEGGGYRAILQPGDPTPDNPERTFWKNTRTKDGLMKSYVLRWISPRSGNIITKNVTELMNRGPAMSRR
jgi:hypothetical protein